MAEDTVRDEAFIQQITHWNGHNRYKLEHKCNADMDMGICFWLSVQKRQWKILQVHNISSNIF